MSKYIYADDLLNFLKDLKKPQDIGFNEQSIMVSVNLKWLIEKIESLPSADVVPKERFDRIMDNLKAVIEEQVVCSEWYDKGSLSCRCSNCGCKNDKETAFCPNCGARMSL